MPSAFSGIEIASNALRAFEFALNITGHNLSNIETSGYSRQRVEFGQTPPLTYFALNPVTMGTGVGIASVNRIRNLFLDGKFWQTSYEQSRMMQLLTTLEQIEMVFEEPGSNGIHSLMVGMFDAWNELSQNPASEASRMNLRLQASLFVQKVRDVHRALRSQQQGLIQETLASIEQINRIAAEISKLNAEIRTQIANDTKPNDLLDLRGKLLDELSTWVDVHTQELADGTMTVYIGEYTLVSQGGDYPLPSDFDAATSSLIDGSDSIEIRGGKLGGLLNGIRALEIYTTQLDTLVTELRNHVNTLHSTGVDLNGTTGIAFFQGANGAADFDLSDEIKADVRNIAAGTSGAPGDGSLALAISRSRDTDLAGLGNRSVLEYHRDLVMQLAQETNAYRTSVAAQESALRQIESQRQSISGVNMDEELAQMMRFQRSYQAAAKILAVFDQVTEELMNILR